jgi:hypothetical protein
LLADTKSNALTAIGAAAALAAWMGASPAAANDTLAVMGTGGLAFEQNQAVRMASEVLKISPGRIDVVYVFKNVTGADVTSTVAFPLPDLDMGVVYNSPTDLPSPDHENFVNFQTWVDGVEVSPSVEVRAFVKGSGKEITGTLREMGLNPLTSLITGTDKGKALEALDAAYATGEDEYTALWVTKVNYHWQQRFPAGKELKIRHTYEPVRGGSLVSDRPSNPDDWCTDESFRGAFKKLQQRHKTEYIQGSWVQYVLKTGANWAGPIGEFSLIIEKPEAEDLISTCPIPGLTLTRTGKTFTAAAKNFTPSADLNILFVHGNCPMGCVAVPRHQRP